MQFYDKTHFYRQLNDEIEELKKYVLDLNILPDNTVLDNVIDNTIVVFNDIDMPYVDSNMQALINLVNSLKNKYKNRTDEESTWFNKFLNRIDIEDLNMCGEGIYYPIFNTQSYKDQEILDDITLLRNTFISSHYGYTVSGNYEHSKRKITIFTRNIDHSYEEYMSVFAHEFFHALHHYILDYCRSNEKLNRYYHRVVLESLATYFQIEYLKHRGLINKANEVSDRAKKHNPIFYPYSGCKDMCKGKCKFIDVLNKSTKSFEEALFGLFFLDNYMPRIIMLMEDNYRIHGIKSSQIYSDGTIKISKHGIRFFKVKQRDRFLNEYMNETIKGSICDYRFDNVSKGDIIFHEVNDQIIAISIAKANTSYDLSGNPYIRCQYELLKRPVDVNGNIHEDYLSDIDYEKAVYMLEKILKKNSMNAIAYLIYKLI